MPAKPSIPAALGVRGAALWRDVTRAYELRADEVRVLEDACREADLIAAMTEALSAASLMQPGRYKAMESVHPLVLEIRQHRRLFALLMAQLKLPDSTELGAVDGKPRSVQARAAAAARWKR